MVHESLLTLWIEGPEFLKIPFDKWPVRVDCDVESQNLPDRYMVEVEIERGNILNLNIINLERFNLDKVKNRCNIHGHRKKPSKIKFLRYLF